MSRKIVAVKHARSRPGGGGGGGGAEQVRAAHAGGTRTHRCLRPLHHSQAASIACPPPVAQGGEEYDGYAEAEDEEGIEPAGALPQLAGFDADKFATLCSLGTGSGGTSASAQEPAARASAVAASPAAATADNTPAVAD